MRALFVLTPPESKRLIGKAVAALEEVKKAKKKARLLIGHGSTNVYVAEEVLGKKKLGEILDREAYLSGVIQRGSLCTIPAEEKPAILVLNRGVVEPPPPTMSELLKDFDRDSIFIKGANAVDLERNAAVMVAHPEGGTIGWAIGTLWARGIRLIVPVGLEKLVPSVKKSVELCGQQSLDYCEGLKVGMIPLTGAKVVTEIEALKILAGAEAFHVASGGNAGSEGCVTLVADGKAKMIEKAIQLVEAIKGEPALEPRKPRCEICILSSPAQPESERKKGVPHTCRYACQKEENLPPYLRNQ
jgi:hypothetical protein